jgi:dUTP pyrophosphatase
MMGNGIGVIDADYYNNPDNEGEIFFQIYNLSPFNIQIKKGEAIGQATILPYGIVENDSATGERVGGFGSTSN